MRVTFSGVVSAQAESGETVTITITKPDGTTEQLTALTQVDGTFSTTKDYPAGDYSALFHIDADGTYMAADIGPIPFTVPLQPRTITASVTFA